MPDKELKYFKFTIKCEVIIESEGDFTALTDTLERAREYGAAVVTDVCKVENPDDFLI